MDAPAAGTIAAILSSVGSIVTQGITWVTSFVGVITSNPLILMFVVVSFVGLGIGLLRRLIQL